ncbi:unnamed protein product [Paramecium primaurelia]|uniref:NACHT domain-containing protein n=1 Tax=Paramecium primaurelia TaxID=5886 RepID=A0A8S1JWA6_PARPR|nr:unnamed protein product [Paramecium primaurelia]
MYLRGGGCGSSTTATKDSSNVSAPKLLKQKIPPDLVNQIKLHALKISSNAVTVLDQQQNLMNSFQFFQLNARAIWLLVKNQKYTRSVIDLVFESLEQLFPAFKSFLQSNILFALYTSQIITQLTWVMFTFYSTNKNRFLELSKQQQYLNELDQISERLEIESDSSRYQNHIEYEIFVIQAIIFITPTNSTEGQDILVKFLGGAFKAIATFSLNDDLIDSLKSGVAYLYQQGIKYCRLKKLELIYSLLTLKFDSMDQMENQGQTKQIVEQLGKVFNEIIKESNDWEIWFAWIQLLQQLYCFKPTLDKLQIDQNLYEQIILKEYSIPIINNRHVIALKYQHIQTDQISKQLFDNSQILQDQALLQNMILQGQGLLSNIEQQYFARLQIQRDQQKQQENLMPISSAKISSILNIARSAQDELLEFYQLIHQDELTDQSKLKQAEKILKNQQKAIMYLLSEIENIQSLQKIVQVLIQNSESDNEIIEEYYQIQQLNIQQYLTGLIKYQSNKYQETFQKDQYVVVIDKLFLKSSNSKDFQKQLQGFKQNQNDQSIIKNLIDAIKKLQYDSSKSRILSMDSLLRLNSAIQLILQEKVSLNWNLELSLILQVRIKIACMEKQLEKNSQTYQQIVQSGNLMIPYETLHQSIKFLYTQYSQCESNQKFKKTEIQVINNLEKLLKIILIENFDSINHISQILIQNLFLEINTPENSNFDLEILKMIEIRAQDSITYINQIQSSIKMISDFLIYEKESNADNRIDVQLLIDQKTLTEIQQIFQQTQLNSYQLQMCVQKLNSYYDSFCIVFLNFQNTLKEKDQNFYEQICEKKRDLEQFIFFFEALVSLNILNKNDQEVVKKLKGDVDKKLQFILDREITKPTTFNIETNNKFTDEIQFYLDIFNQLDEIRQNQEVQLNKIKQFQNICNEILLQAENLKTLEKLSQQLPEYDTLLMETQNHIKQLLAQLDNKSLNIKVDYITIQNLIQKRQNYPYQKDLQSQIIFILSQIDTKEAETNFIEDKIDDIKEQLMDLLTQNKWRIRQVIIYELQQMRSFSLSQQSMNFSAGLLVKFQVFETDKRIRVLFESQKGDVSILISKFWPSQEQQIQNKIKEKLKELNNIAQQLTIENDPIKKNLIKKEYAKLEKEIQGILENVQNIGNQLGITVLFMQDLKQDLLRIENQIQQLQEMMENINKDIKYLKGRSVKELLEIRMQRVLQQRLIHNSDNVYIQIQTKEKNLEEGIEDSESVLFTEDLFGNGEINEFIWKQQKDSLLIHGQAGSGKSTAARKIEEYLWIIYQKNKNQQDYIPLIPIFVSLPQLKDPIYCAIEETLRSDNYRFSERQVEELKEAVELKQYRLIIILDSYDELKQQYIGLNLNASNRLSKWRCISDKNKYPKLITTSRSELFTINGYCSWFFSESNQIKFYKEVRLLKFTESQIQQYIDEYTQLCVKRVIKDFYFAAYQDQNYQEFENFYNELVKQVGIFNFKQNKPQMLSNEMINTLLQRCKQFVPNEHLKTIQQMLNDIWSGWHYQNFIKLMKLESLMETPFMVEIVMAVLPYIVKQRQEINNIKENFIKKYIYLSKKGDSIQKQALDEWQRIVGNQQFITEFVQEFQISEQEKKIQQYFEHHSKLQIIKQALLQEPLSTYDFYGEFFEHYFRRQIYKLRESGEQIEYDSMGNELWEFAHKLANEMTFRNLSQVQFQPSGLIFKKNYTDWKDKFFNDDDKEGVYKRLFRKCIPIKSKSGIYSFNHKSLQEFLVAKWFIDQISKMTLIVQDKYVNVKLEEQDELLQYNFFEKSWDLDYMQGPIKFIIDKIKFNEEIKQKLMNLIYCSKINMKFLTGSSNSFYILNQMGQSFIGQDFSEIKIGGISLNNANFFNCNFNNSAFQNVKLSRVNLNQSKIINVNWQEIQVDELPTIDSKMNSIDQITYIQSKELFIVSDDFQIKQYNIFKLQEENQLKFQFKPKQIVLSNNEQYLALMNNNEILLFDIYRNNPIQKLIYGECFSSYKQCITFSPDDQYIILGGPDGADQFQIQIIYENVDEQQISEINNNSNINSNISNSKVDTILYNSNEKDVQLNQQSSIINRGESRKFNIKQLQDDIISPEKFTSLTDEHVVSVKCAKIIVFQHYSNTFSIYNHVDKKIDTHESRFQRMTCLDINKDSTLIATGGYLGEIHVFQVNQIDQFFGLDGHKDYISQLQFSRDGKQLVSCSWDKTIRLWNTQQQSQISQISFYLKPKVLSLSLINDTSLAMTGFSDGLIQMWDLESSDSKQDPQKGHSQKITCAIFSIDGKYIISGSFDKTIKIWNSETGQQKGHNLIKHTQAISALSISEDQTLLCSGSIDGFIYIWDFETQKFQKEIKHYGSEILDIRIIFYNNEYRILSQTSEETAQLWINNNFSEYYLLFDYNESNKEKRKILGYESKEIINQSKDLQVDVGRSYNILYYFLRDQKITAIESSFDNQTKLIGTDKGILLIIQWNGQSQQRTVSSNKPLEIIKTINHKYFLTINEQKIEIWKFSDYVVKDTVVSGDQKIIDVFVCNDNIYCGGNYIEIWNVHQKTKLQKKFCLTDSLSSIGYNQNKNLIYAGLRNGSIIIYDATFSHQQIFNAHGGQIKKILWLNSKNILLTAGDDWKLKLWDQQNNLLKEVTVVNPIQSFFVSLDETYFILQDVNNLSLWDLDNLELMENMVKIQKNTKVLAVFPNQQVFWANDAQMQVLPIMNKKIKFSLLQSNKSHFSKTIATTDKMILTADYQGNIFFWNFDGEKIKQPIITSKNELRSMNLSNDNTKIILGFKNLLNIIDLTNNEIIYTKEIHETSLLNACFLSLTEIIAVSESENFQTLIFNIENVNQQPIIINEHVGSTQGIQVHFLTKTYLTFGNDKAIRYYVKCDKEYSCKYACSSIQKFECQGAIIQNSEISSKSKIDLKELFKQKKAILMDQK